MCVADSRRSGESRELGVTFRDQSRRLKNHDYLVLGKVTKILLSSFKVMVIGKGLKVWSVSQTSTLLHKLHSWQNLLDPTV